MFYHYFESKDAFGEATEIVPFLVEDELNRIGGMFSSADDWQPYVVQDCLLITGQNPASPGSTADALIELVVNVSGASA